MAQYPHKDAVCPISSPSHVTLPQVRLFPLPQPHGSLDFSITAHITAPPSPPIPVFSSPQAAEQQQDHSAAERLLLRAAGAGEAVSAWRLGLVWVRVLSEPLGIGFATSTHERPGVPGSWAGAEAPGGLHSVGDGMKSDIVPLNKVNFLISP